MMTTYALSLMLAAFAVTGNAQCKKLFTDGALALHSFEYDEAHRTFKKAIEADKQCAMAHWGDAMAYNHPLWGEDWAPLAREALKQIDASQKLDPSEQAHIANARALFGEGTLQERTVAWLAATEASARAFPKDDELQLQYALALIANSERYTNVRRLMQSAAISMDVFARQPNHPGAAHYLIHACDSPDHAVLALPAARVYARIAPTATHAMHMPSHIFVQLGMWQEAAKSNEDAWGALLKKINGGWIPEFHSYSWLGAAYLELGRIDDAKAIIADMTSRLKQHDDATERDAFTDLARKYITDTGRWSEAKDVFAVVKEPLLETGESSESLGCAMHMPGGAKTTGVRPPFGLAARARMQVTLAEAAMHAGNVDEARVILTERQKTLSSMRPWKGLVDDNLLERARLQDATILAGAKAYHDKQAPSWASAIAAAQAWAATDTKAILGPAFDPPAMLTVADFQLEAGRTKEALASYKAVLARVSNLGRARQGVERAHALSL
jgi:tetratricopeptide (TPR) repeat protein